MASNQQIRVISHLGYTTTGNISDLLLERTKMVRIKLKSHDYPKVVRYLWGSNIVPVLVAGGFRGMVISDSGRS